MRLSAKIKLNHFLDLETTKETVIVGRSSKCDFVIPHESISRRHCQILKEDDQFFIVDTGSSNGTFVDHLKVLPGQKTPFKKSSLLTLGKVECLITDLFDPLPAGKRITLEELRRANESTTTKRVSTVTSEEGELTIESPSVPSPQAKKNVPKAPIKSEIQKSQSNQDSKKLYQILGLILILLLALVYFLTRST